MKSYTSPILALAISVVAEVENKLRVALTAPWPEPSQLRR